MKQFAVIFLLLSIVVVSQSSCASTKHKRHNACNCPDQADNPRVNGPR